MPADKLLPGELAGTACKRSDKIACCGALFAAKGVEMHNTKHMKEDKNTVCDPCEQNFERNIDELVSEGKAPTAKERQQKEREIESAFAGTGKEK